MRRQLIRTGLGHLLHGFEKYSSILIHTSLSTITWFEKYINLSIRTDFRRPLDGLKSISTHQFTQTFRQPLNGSKSITTYQFAPDFSPAIEWIEKYSNLPIRTRLSPAVRWIEKYNNLSIRTRLFASR
jgi:hypothetical protein